MSKNKNSKSGSVSHLNEPIWTELNRRLQAVRDRLETLYSVARNGRYMEVTVKAHVVKRHKRKAHTRIVFMAD